MRRSEAPERELTEAERSLIDAMERYADGDAAAFNGVYGPLAPVVRRCLVRWVGDPDLAHDLVQETFMRVHRARDRYLTGAPVGPWVLTIARRLSIDALRRRGRARDRLTREGELPEPQDVAPPDEPTPQWLVDEVRAAVAALPESQRLVVSMHKLEGRPLADIARDLDIQEGAARVRAHRGYQRLKEALGQAFKRHTGPEG
jgi:RNA polymerase sigma-70 factor (ECF subfamily)